MFNKSYKPDPAEVFDMAPGGINTMEPGTHYMPGLPTDAKARKKIPLATGCLDYFPDALAEIAQLSQLGNDKHNPGEPLHWSRGKSNDHPDCLIRHFVERGKMDFSWPVPVRHSIEMAWRALAIAQLEIEASQEIIIPDGGKPKTPFDGAGGGFGA